ncbi:HEAT repeat domain-containing protein [Rhodobacteraceae bacterium B1Z28]|uniref:HEAT repeat domain-containing protein n=1 Tax=Ruegeria haliotis TaxID=2747601 RepID=A0ABX2PZA5_9RHOB|nr:HEAT repeat domain-containing protein [Ruegeria haliotis]NVO58412.1 HEAT repeat domain-containing protein [Ruegeria haliotis]
MTFQSDTALRDEATRLFSEYAKSEYDVIRLRAIQALTAIGAKSSPALVEALLDDDEDVRQDAAQALGALGVKEAAPQLLENLIHDPCGEVKLACVTALAELKAADAAPYLRMLVTGRGEEITWDEDELHQDEWDDWLDAQIASIKALGAMGDEAAIEPIVLALMDEDGQELGDVACEALGRIGQPSVPTLGVFTQSSNRRLRHRALRTIAAIGGDEAEAILRKALSDKDGAIRLLAYEALMPDDPALVDQALTDAIEDIRIAALNRSGFSEPELLDRMMRDPGAKVQLALIERLERDTPIADSDDLRWQVLDFLATGQQPEVSAQAFGLLAALAPQLVTDRLNALFSAGVDDLKAERLQWAIVDALASSPLGEAAEWLQRACRSPFRSVRLKAVASLAMIVTDENRPHVNQQQGRELLLSYALAPMPVVAEEEPEETAPKTDIAALEEAGLDVSEGGENGPTSSLGAILGHDAIAAEMTQEAEEGDMQPLTPREQALLAKATRHPKRRRVALDDNAEALERETRLSAIRLLGEVRGMQVMLAQIAKDPETDIAQQALSALGVSVARHGAELSQKQLVELITLGLSHTDSGLSLQALKLLQQADLPPQDALRGKLRAMLKTGDTPFRIDAMHILTKWDGTADVARGLLDDVSAPVRQAAMRLMSEIAPDQAGAAIVPFLLANPEQRIVTYVNDSTPAVVSIGRTLLAELRDHDRRAEWPIMISALADLLGEGSRAV